ncbi:MAG: pyrimidine 5'-nucleotidase [Chloroflexota bacterium]|nr:MAG: pyrimidine 5'-nucleotidase [Bellilinea sp.]
MNMKPELLIFDLDDTLYPPESGLWHAIGERINLYIQNKLGLTLSEAITLRDQMYHQYGTTLRGLQSHYSIPAEEYLAFVHNVPVNLFLKPDPVLRTILVNIPIRKIIFTNGDRAHAHRVLSALQLEDCFDEVVDIQDIEPYCKPMPQSFQLALQKVGVEDISRCVLFEDSPRNLSVARSLGMFTIHVGKNGVSSEAHLRISDIHELISLFTPEFSILHRREE